jgi:HK97 family phage major capsid protein
MSALDTQIRKLENELEDKKSAYEALLSHADKEGREPNEMEDATLSELTTRMEEINARLVSFDKTEQVLDQFQTRATELDQRIATRREEPGGVKYGTAGDYMVDVIAAMKGSRESHQRLEVYTRAASHQKTADNLGVVPDPLIGPVVNYTDSVRPLINLLGPRPMPAATWHRPRVTQRASVAAQGAAGAAGDEKAELVSQKMTITRLTANAVTYGGYVNISRQDIDFSSPQIMDIVAQDLADLFAEETEEALGTELDASTATAVGYGASPTADTIRAALWSAAEDVYTAVKGRGQLILALAPDRLAAFGPLFPPITNVTETGEGLSAGMFGSGSQGRVAGVQTVMSAGLGSTKAFLFSTAAIEAYEQRVGLLSVIEPSVLGVQVAYAGYFTPLTIEDGGIIELTAA